MPAQAEEVLGMLKAGGLIAAFAGPLAVIGALVARRRFWPCWRMPAFVWPAPVVLGFFVVAQFVFPLILQVVLQSGLGGMMPAANLENVAEVDRASVQLQLHFMWASLVFVPALLIVAALARTIWLRAPLRFTEELRNLPRSFALGTLVCFTFGAAAFVLNAVLPILFEYFGWAIAEHPLSKLGRNGDGVGGWLFIAAACITAPLLEEFLYRGLLVPLAGKKRYRPWLLIALAAAMTCSQGLKIGPLLFIGFLMAIQFLLQLRGKKVWKRFPNRTVHAIWSSSALFAAAHSSIWPSPIPLFVFALGLGWLCARTRSWIPGFFAHALFNAISTAFVFSRG